MKKRVVSWLLVVLMLTSMLPTGVWAEDVYRSSEDAGRYGVSTLAGTADAELEGFFNEWEGIATVANAATRGFVRDGDKLKSGNSAASNSGNQSSNSSSSESNSNSSSSNNSNSSNTSSGWQSGVVSAYGSTSDGTLGAHTATGAIVSESSMGVAVPMSMPNYRSYFGRSVEISYGGRTVVAVVNDCGGLGGGSRALDLQPGVWKALGASSCFDWGVRTVSYRFL